MSDQPGIPAITVFPPFSPAARQADPAPAPASEQAPPTPEPSPSPIAEAPWDAPAPAVPMSWDFEAAAPPAEPRAEPSASAEDDGAPEDASDDDEDLPWLEVPSPRADAPAEGEAGLKADDAPNWMDWVRDADHEPAAEADASADADTDADATPIGELAPDDAQPWSPETETAADDWAAPGPSPEPWQASAVDWAAPESGLELPDPELYDLPGVTPSDSPWADAGAAAAEQGEAEPAWELPAQAASDAPPAWESFAPPSAAAEPEAAAEAPEPASAAPEAASADSAPSAEASGPFAAVADRLQAIADALRADPGAFLSGAQGGGDPLALLVAGFVMGYNARQGGS
jgi:hypothetical protein